MSDKKLSSLIAHRSSGYFELLGFTPAFDLNLNALESAYFKAQRQYHPDRFVGRPAAERQQALQRSVDVNNAYNTLKNPLSRAQYLLQLQGIAVGTEADSVKPSPEVLMEAMEMRESPPDAAVLERLTAECALRVGRYYDAKDWPAMAQETLRLTYLTKAQAKRREK